jgi:hypothetical protein
LVTLKKNVEITIKIYETARYQCGSGCSTQIYIDSLAQLVPELKQLRDAGYHMCIKIKPYRKIAVSMSAVFSRGVLSVDEWVGRLEDAR